MALIRSILMPNSVCQVSMIKSDLKISSNRAAEPFAPAPVETQLLMLSRGTGTCPARKLDSWSVGFQSKRSLFLSWRRGETEDHFESAYQCQGSTLNWPAPCASASSFCFPRIALRSRDNESEIRFSQKFWSLRN